MRLNQKYDIYLKMPSLTNLHKASILIYSAFVVLDNQYIQAQYHKISNRITR